MGFKGVTKVGEKILIIEDDPQVADFLKQSLELEGYQCSSALNGIDGLNKIKKENPDLVLLDLGLPDIDGIEVCKKIKTNIITQKIPIIMLTARTQTEDSVTGLETGADDYIVKPFTPQELLARIKGMFRRMGYYVSEPEEIISKGGVTMEITSRRIMVNIPTEIDLAPKEFELLYLLMRNSNKALRREYLLKTLWGYEDTSDSRTLDVHIQRLRKKLGEQAGKRIETVESYGYRFVD